MPLVPEDQRAAALHSLNLSPALRNMALGQRPPTVFQFRVNPVFKVYTAGGRPLTDAGPAGMLTLPLWESGTTVPAVRQEATQRVFFTFSLEDPVRRAHDLARTEQGLWAALFAEAYEDEFSDEELAAAAADVGFRYWPLVLARSQAADQDSFEASGAFRRALMAEIDALAEG